MSVPQPPHDQDAARPSEHLVQLFDSPESLGDAVASFLADGLGAGDNLLVIAKPSHVQAIGEGLRRHGVSVSSAVDAGRLIILDASTTLRLVMKRGVPNISALRTVVENTVDQIAPHGERITIYGELVELLAEEGNYAGAEQLEAFWNEFGATHPISLFCGYSSAHFVMPATLGALRAICAAHGHVVRNRRDLLANWILARTESAVASA